MFTLNTIGWIAPARGTLLCTANNEFRTAQKPRHRQRQPGRKAVRDAVRAGGDPVGATRGIYLVFASLIVPALAAKRFAEGSRLVVGYVVGLIGYVLGLVCSSVFDLPTGAVIVSLMVPERLRAVPTIAHAH
jgi:hypothetical protein